MLTHTISSGVLAGHVRVEVVLERNPSFGGEELGAIVRFRHLGEPAQAAEAVQADGRAKNEPQPSAEAPLAPAGAGSDWFGKRLSLQLSNTARALFLEELEDQKETKVDLRNEPVDLYSGYVQLYGGFTYDRGVFNEAPIEEFRSRSTIAGRIGGLQGLEVSKAGANGVMSYLSSGIGSLLNSNIGELAIESSGKKDDEELGRVVPFFTTAQSLLFSELHLESGKVQQYYVRCKLPKSLPPSYNGAAISINYKLIVGAIPDSAVPKPVTLRFPVKVSPFFDSDSYQPVANLTKFILLPQNLITNEPVAVEHGRRKSLFALSSKPLIDSTNTTTTTTTTRKKEFIKILQNMVDNEDSEVEDTIESTSKNVKDTIKLFSQHVLNKNEIDNELARFINVDNISYERQINKLQTQYLISFNSKSITNLTFSKPFYKIGDDIKLSFDLTDKDLQITGILVMLENLEIVKDSALADINDKHEQKIRTVFKKSFTTFNTDTINISIPIPLEATNQFKTSLFELKWAVSIKFILNTQEKLVSVHKDDVGEFWYAAESLNGKEFNCRLPLMVLPSDEDFGGNLMPC